MKETFVPWVEKGHETLDKLKSTGLKFVEFPNPWAKTDTTRVPSSILALYSGRYIVSVNINGVNVPFYQSTGEAGKEKVASAKWYPFFGIGADGWINKGREEQIINFYGSPELKAVASKLDAATGDIRDLQFSKLVIVVKEGSPVIDAINNGLNPSVHEGGGRATAENIQNVLQRIGTKTTPTKGDWKYGSNDPHSKDWGGNDRRNFQKTPEPVAAGSGWKYGSDDPNSKDWGGNDRRNFEAMNFKDWLINEMPISKFQLMGQWGPDAKRAYGYSNKIPAFCKTPPLSIKSIAIGRTPRMNSISISYVPIRPANRSKWAKCHQNGSKPISMWIFNPEKMQSP